MTDKIDKEKFFEEKAQTILKYLKSPERYSESFIPRPFFVEFTGSPSSGKTTTIVELDKFLRRQGFRVWKPLEGAEEVRHIERTTPLYNIRTGLYALQLLIDLSHGHQYDIVLFDRCIFDAYCWMMYWLEKKQLITEEQEMIQAFFLLRFWTHRIDAAYFMICDPAVAMTRELRIALSKKTGETTNPATIASLVNRYKKAYEVLSPKYAQLVLVDTTNLTDTNMVEKIAYNVLDIFETKAKTEHTALKT